MPTPPLLRRPLLRRPSLQLHRGLSAFHAFGVDGFCAGIWKTSQDAPLRWGDRCVMVNGYSLANVREDQVFIFSGAVKTNNAAWSVVLLTTFEQEPGVVEPGIVVLPLGAVSILSGTTPEDSLIHMAALQRVRRCVRCTSCCGAPPAPPFLWFRT